MMFCRTSNESLAAVNKALRAEIEALKKAVAEKPEMAP